MTTVALSPKTTTIEELKKKSKETPEENPSIEMSAKDEVKNRGRKIREIKKALKSMKKISRGTVEDKERIIKLEQILEHYLKEQKNQLSERYNKEFLKTKAYIPSIITKFPKAVGISAQKIGITIDQLKLSKTHKEAAYNFFQTMKSIGQTAATPVVYAGKFIIDNWYLSLLLPILKPEIFENLIEKGKNLLSGNDATEAIESTQTVVEIPTLQENPTSQVTGNGEIPIPIAFEDTGGIETTIMPETVVQENVANQVALKKEVPIPIAFEDTETAEIVTHQVSTEESVFRDKIDMEALLAEENAIEIIPTISPGEAIESQLTNDPNMEYGTLIDEYGVEHQVPLITLDPIEPIENELDPTQGQETVDNEILDNEENTNTNLNPALAKKPAETVTEEPKVNEEDVDTKKDIDVNVRRLTIDVRLFNFRLFKFTIPLPNFSLNRKNFAIAYENNNEPVKSL